MKLYHWVDRSVLIFKNRARDFLMAYSTNTPDKPSSAFVDLRGRIVAVFDQIAIPNQDAVLIVIGQAFRQRVLEHLDKYLDLFGTSVEEDARQVYFDLDGSYLISPEELTLQKRGGKIILTSRQLEATVDEEAFRRFRLREKLPLQGMDYDQEMLLNVGDEEFVSYTKGCYLGQEIIARVHHLGKPPKRLVVQNEKFLFVEN